MISIEEALEHIRRCVGPLEPRRLPLNELLGLRLAEDVTSTVDSPPFDKSMVDGYAIATSDASETLHEIELVTAGQTPTLSVRPGVTIRVMTGAPVPEGADAVVKWEDCEVASDGSIRNPQRTGSSPTPAKSVKSGSCILRRGSSFHTGEVVLPAGKRLGPLDIALLAEIGQAEATVVSRPRVGVLPTGDELVEAGEPIGAGQIRNSNGPMLRAALTAAGFDAVDLGVGRDTVDDLWEKISSGLECNVLLVSGGVSAGVKDLVPGVLTELGVVEQFHQVRVKPGKPLWFGVREAAPGKVERRTLVFGLPGNPVSTLVSFRLFVLPALRALAGDAFEPAATERAALSKGIGHRGGRPTYHPCRVVGKDASGGLRVVEPLDWRGSADLATLTRADCLAVFLAGDYELAAGAGVEIVSLEF